MQENCVIYTLDELGCMAQGIDTKGAVTPTDTNSEVEELKKQLAEKDEDIAYLDRRYNLLLSELRSYGLGFVIR